MWVLFKSIVIKTNQSVESFEGVIIWSLEKQITSITEWINTILSKLDTLDVSINRSRNNVRDDYVKPLKANIGKMVEFYSRPIIKKTNIIVQATSNDKISYEEVIIRENIYKIQVQGKIPYEVGLIIE